jgi:diguanylate cyclase (GGDEF)-like protein
MTASLHPLLQRQLRRLGVHSLEAAPTPAAFAELLGRVSRAYVEADQDRYLLERSQDLASTEMAELYAALRQGEARLASLLSLSADWVWEQDADERLTYISEGVQKTAGRPAEHMLGCRRRADAGDPAEQMDWPRYLDSLAGRRAFRELVYRWTPPGADAPRYISISGEPVLDAEGRFAGFRGVGRDVTQTVAAERQVRHLASVDDLTGLPNRQTFLAALQHALQRPGAKDGRIAVCFIDLDRFKTVNDKLGHGAGDALLQSMAGRLRAALRGVDTVARLGGDEFVLLLESCGSAAQLQALVEKVLQAIGQPLDVQGHSFVVTGSIGIARFPADGRDAATLLKHADAAMYLAKSRGRNNMQHYSAELEADAERAFQTEADLRLALLHGELLLHYQPKVDVASGLMVGIEALVRWLHPHRGLVPPGEFIPLAEERGLIVPLGRWVIDAACAQARAWRQAGLTVPPVAVNLSACQFTDDGLVETIEQALRQYKLPPTALEVELTESVLMAEPERATQVLSALHAMGVRMAIDDFGTGYSSLSYLKRFPASTVKIDRSFIDGLPGDHNDLAITQGVIAMAHSLDLLVVAEGVETEAQLQALRALGCDQVQGYLLGRPVPAHALLQRLLPALETFG